jgi:hypothetical protein
MAREYEVFYGNGTALEKLWSGTFFLGDCGLAALDLAMVGDLLKGVGRVGRPMFRLLKPGMVTHYWGIVPRLGFSTGWKVVSSSGREVFLHAWGDFGNVVVNAGRSARKFIVVWGRKGISIPVLSHELASVEGVTHISCVTANLTAQSRGWYHIPYLIVSRYLWHLGDGK